MSPDFAAGLFAMFLVILAVMHLAVFVGGLIWIRQHRPKRGENLTPETIYWRGKALFSAKCLCALCALGFTLMVSLLMCVF